jgi:hypothetical protein
MDCDQTKSRDPGRQAGKKSRGRMRDKGIENTTQRAFLSLFISDFFSFALVVVYINFSLSLASSDIILYFYYIFFVPE